MGGGKKASLQEEEEEEEEEELVLLSTCSVAQEVHRDAQGCAELAAGPARSYS